MNDAKHRLFVHIGTHKTGSSSLQHYLGSIRGTLLQRGFAYFEGKYEVNNHIELFAAAMRPGRDSFSRTKYGIESTTKEVTATFTAFNEFKIKNIGRTLIASSEGLSLLRYDDELEKFKTMIGAASLEIIPILVLRNRSDFLNSFRKQILKHPNREISKNPDNIHYVEEDSWLADFDAIQEIWRQHFGKNSLRVIDYDKAMNQDGDVLPAILKAMQIPSDLIVSAGTIRVNTDTLKTKIKRFLRTTGLYF